MALRNEKAMGAFRTDVARSYEAKPEKVFDAWVNPSSVKAWLADGEKAIVDPREDGLFYLEMPYEGRNYPHYAAICASSGHGCSNSPGSAREHAARNRS
jgi:uncharacterized protein YndB with AHSA1/START domain